VPTRDQSAPGPAAERPASAAQYELRLLARFFRGSVAFQEEMMRRLESIRLPEPPS